MYCALSLSSNGCKPDQNVPSTSAFSATKPRVKARPTWKGVSKVALHEVLVEVCSSARNRKFEHFLCWTCNFFLLIRISSYGNPHNAMPREVQKNVANTTNAFGKNAWRFVKIMYVLLEDQSEWICFFKSQPDLVVCWFFGQALQLYNLLVKSPSWSLNISLKSIVSNGYPIIWISLNPMLKKKCLKMLLFVFSVETTTGL